MPTLHPDLLIALLPAFLVLGATAIGLLALPWSEAEVAESAHAWSRAGGVIVRAARRPVGRPEVRAARLPMGNADALLPAPSPLVSPDWSRCARARRARPRSRTTNRAT